MDSSNPVRFLLAWETDHEVINSELSYARIYASRFEIDGTCIEDTNGDGPRFVSGFYDDGTNGTLRNSSHSYPSLGLSGDGRVRVGWLSSVSSVILDSAVHQNGQLLISDFDFDDLASTWPISSPSPSNLLDSPPSVGAADANADVRGVVWSRTHFSVAIKGLYHSPPTPATTDDLDTCDDFCTERDTQWSPCMALRDDGIAAIIWSKAENESLEDSPFNIALQLFGPDGDAVGNPVTVNESSLDPENTIQYSPSIAFDPQGNIAICWVGTTPDGCDENNPTRIHARLLKWDGGESTPYAVTRQILVDNDYDLPPSFSFDVDDQAHPSVALSPLGDARWIVGWNTTDTNGLQDIHGQYFDHGRPLGGKFRVNQMEATQTIGDEIRRMGTSAQHTLAFAETGEVIATWSANHTSSS